MSYVHFTYTQTADGVMDTVTLTQQVGSSFPSEQFTIENSAEGAWFRVHFIRELTITDVAVLQALVAVHVGLVQELRVLPLLDPQFVGYMPYKIDFRKHLLPNTHIQKNVIMHPNGRPDYAIYTYGGVDIARIRFVFDLSAYSLVTRRREILGYYDSMGTIPNEYTISDETYNIDPSSPSFSEYHLVKAMAERVYCRQYVIERIKGVLNSFILQYYMDNYGLEFMEILDSVSAFFTEYNNAYSTWMNTGAGSFISLVVADTLFPFLDLVMEPATEAAPPVTVRDYIVARLQAA